MTMPELTPWSYWNQLDDWTADGKVDENAKRNCLWECAAMVIEFITGVELSADFLKDRVYGDGYTGDGYVWDGANALSRWAGIPARARGVSNGDVIRMMRENIDDGRPLILLVRFIETDINSGHFVTAVGYDDDNVIVADPWGGQRRIIPNGDFTGVWFKNWVVDVLRRRCIDQVEA